MKKDTIIKFYSDFKLYIFPAIVSLSSLFLIVFAIYPQTVKLINNQKSADNLISKSKFLETKVTALESINEQDLSQKVAFALASLPSEKDFGNIFELLQQIVSGSGFSISSITLSSGGSKMSSADSYEVKLEIKGTKVMFPILLSNLENSSRLVRINNIDLASRQVAEGLDASLVLEVLYAPVPTNFGTADSPLPELSQTDEELLAKLSAGRSVTQTGDQSLSPRGKSNPFE